MIQSITLVNTIEDLNKLLFHLLAYGRPDYNEGIAKQCEEPTGIQRGDGLIETIKRFIIALQDPVTKSPVVTKDTVEACREIFRFLPLTDDLLAKIETALDALWVVSPKIRVKKRKNPVAYFFGKARKLPGFKLLALAVRDLIVQHGPRVIPAVLAACTVLHDGVKHFNLRPQDIAAVERYVKRNEQHLERRTEDNYRAVQKMLVDATRELYKEIKYGSAALHCESEDLEWAREDSKKIKVFNTQFPHISEVLSPGAIRKILTYAHPLKITDAHTFNEISKRHLPTMTFVYGSKIEDLADLEIHNYERHKKRIRRDIIPDLLLKEKTIYMPLHDEISAVIDALIDYRAKYRPVSLDDRLFTIQTGSAFYPIDKHEVQHLLARVSGQDGLKIDERTLYDAHLAYFVDLAGLNAVFADRIADRKHALSLVPRLYTMSSLHDLRAKHYAAFRKVSEGLGIKINSDLPVIPDEKGIMLGGLRAPGKDAIKAVFEYFMERRPLDFALSNKWLWFLNNYAAASRAAEITGLHTKSADCDLGVNRFRVRDAGLKKDTTKVIPFIDFTLDEYKRHFDLRGQYLSMRGLPDPGTLLLREGERALLPLDGDYMNDFYHIVAVSMGVTTFTSHCVRYMAQSDVTAKGLSFKYTNCLLSHYPAYDEIFNPYSDVSYLDFAKEYGAVMESLLTEYLR